MQSQAGLSRYLEQWLNSSRTSIALSACGVLAAFAILWVLKQVQRRFWYSFSNLSGPKADSWTGGSIPYLMSKQTGEASREWFSTYGPTIQWRSALYVPAIMTSDLGLTSYILTHDEEFVRGQEQVNNFRALLGDHSILTAEKDAHRRLRRIMAPAFGHGAMNAQWPAFLEKTNELKAKIPIDPKGAKVGSMSQMGKLTTDVVGLSSFGLDLGALKGKPNELYQAWQKVLMSTRSTSRWQSWQPWLGSWARYLPGEVNKLRYESRQTFLRVGQRILDTRRRELVEAAEAPDDVKRSDFTGKDAISILLRANMAQDTKESAKMSDAELVDAMSTIMIASTLTTTSSLMWVLHYLATRPEIQDKVRAEVSQLSDEPTADEINNLAYLEAFTREVLRLYSAAATQIRTAAKTITLPLSEPVLGRDGRVMDTVTIDKGSTVYMPIPNLNTSTAVFGADAEVFRPERHLDTSIKGEGFPSVWGQTMTFSYGIRPCLGFRFAVLQIKAVLFTLLRSFEISEPEGQEVVRMGMIGGSKTVLKGTNNSDIPVIFKPLSKQV